MTTKEELYEAIALYHAIDDKEFHDDKIEAFFEVLECLKKECAGRDVVLSKKQENKT